MEQDFFKIPKVFVNGKYGYKNMETDSKILYGVLEYISRMDNNKKLMAKEDTLFFEAPMELLINLTGWHNKKIIKHLKELEEYGVLSTIWKGFDKPNRYYLFIQI